MKCYVLIKVFNNPDDGYIGAVSVDLNHLPFKKGLDGYWIMVEVHWYDEAPH